MIPVVNRKLSVSYILCLMLAASGASGAFAQQRSPHFAPGNLVVVVEGCGVHGGTCTSVLNGTGTNTGNSVAGGYGDNQAAPLTLFQYKPNGTSSVRFVNSLVLPQTASGANLPISSEYGSSSEGTIQLSGAGQYLTLMGYGIDAPTFDAAYTPGFTGDPFGAAPSGALAQSGSLTGQNYTPVPRVITLIDPYGNVNSSTALYNVFNTNNPRSVYTADGVTAYVSGQGTGCDLTGGVFYTKLGAVNDAPTAITGGDANPTSSCMDSGYTGSLIAQDTRTVQIYDGTLYISADSKEGKSDNRSFIGTLGTPPATSLFTPPTQTSGYTTGQSQIPGWGNNGGTGKVTITTSASTNGNPLNNSTTTVNKAALNAINLSPSNYFFASPSVLYVADTGNPKNDSNGDNNSTGTTNIGDGGLQKWVNSSSDGSGTWSLAYTLYQGLNLVNNGSASGTTGLYGLTGKVSSDGSTVYLYATNATIGDLDPTNLYGITDTLSNTTPPGASEAFTVLEAAPADSNFKGVSFTPSLPAGSATIISRPSGLAFTSSGTGCEPGTYTTPVTLTWTPGARCTLSAAPQAGPEGSTYVLARWQNGRMGASETVRAPATAAVYSASFNMDYLLTTTAGKGGWVSPGGYIPAGRDAVIVAKPFNGYHFVDFTDATTSATHSSNPLTLQMDAPHSITAVFAGQIAPTVSFRGAPASAPMYSSFTVSATSNNPLARASITARGSCRIFGDTVTMTAPSGICLLSAYWPAAGEYLGASATQSTVAKPPALPRRP